MKKNSPFRRTLLFLYVRYIISGSSEYEQLRNDVDIAVSWAEVSRVL